MSLDMKTESVNTSKRTPRAPVVYCHCTYAKIVPEETKLDVLRALSASGQTFEAVADLCEMSARKDPVLGQIANREDVKIVACFPRAVKWLFHAAGVALPASAEVLNMREQSADEITPLLLEGKPLTEVPS